MGQNNSPEGLSKALNTAFFVTFKSEGRGKHLPEPARQAFINELWSHDVTVVDYWAQ